MKKYKIGVAGSNLNKYILPLAEPELAKIIKKNIENGRLSFSNEFKQLKTRDIVWLAFDTPVDDRGNVDLGPIRVFFRKNVGFFKNNALIIISSHVPVGTCAEIEKFLAKL